MGDTMSVEKNRESLSALLDGEASELESRRLLRDMTDEDAACLARWQLVSDLMQGHQAKPVPESFNARLMTALEEERHGRPAWMHPVASLAVAASVAVATVVGWQYWEYNKSLNAPAVATTENRLPTLLGGVDTAEVSQQLRSETQEASLKAEEDRMDAMMVRHNEFVARHSGQGMMASVRFISQEANKDSH